MYKKIFFTVICLSLFAGSSMAQYSRVNLVDDMRDNAPELYRSYKTGSTLSGFGMGLTIGGLAVAVAGVATADKTTTTSGGQTTVNLSGSGGAVFAAGMVCALVGTPVWIIGSAKKRNARRAFIRDYGDLSDFKSPRLKLHSSASSAGLALVF